MSVRWGRCGVWNGFVSFDGVCGVWDLRVN